MPRPPRHPAIPTLNGVSASCVALPSTPKGAAPWTNLLDFLAQRFPHVPRDDWSRRLGEGEVLDDTGQALPIDAPFRPGSRVFYYRQVDAEPVVPLEETVLFADDHLVVADKPHFLPVTPGGRHVQQTLLVRLKQRLGLDTLVPLHRLDRETAGVVLLAVQPAERNAYQALFRTHAVTKVYEAVAPASRTLRFPLRRQTRLARAPQFFRQTEVPGDANTDTWIECLAQDGAFAHYRLTPRTGRQHQLRVHMAALGLPIVNDLFYPEVVHGPAATDDLTRPLQLLARTLAFTDPVTGQARHFESARQLVWPPPGDDTGG